MTEWPALAVIGLWIVLQFVNGIGQMAQTAETGGVAYAAHLGGFVAGLALVWVFRQRSAQPARA
jgi:membrane associated rhomboid family serine protease